MSLEKIRLLLQEFNIQKRHLKTEKPTIFQISGYPHYENVASNILRFFLDPSEGHGMKNLFLDSLCQLLGEDLCISEGVNVEREVRTINNNRIDIVVNSDDFVIAIENKCFATENNDFNDYQQYILKEHGGKKIFLLKLSLFPGQSIKGWKNITYEEYFNEVGSCIGNYLSDIDMNYLNYFLDFKKNCEFLRKGTNMDLQLLNFLRENKQEINDLYEMLIELRNEMLSKTKNLKSVIESDDLYPSFQFKDIKCWLWRDKSDLMEVLVFDIKPDDSTESIAIDLIISLSGWKCKIFYRNKRERENIDRLINWLNERNKLSGSNMKFSDLPIEDNRILFFQNEAYENDLAVKDKILELLSLLSYKK